MMSTEILLMEPAEGKRDFTDRPFERENGTSLMSTVCEGGEPRGHARKRLMQAA